MFYHNIDSVLFNVFGLEIRYYGLFYIIGFIIAYFFIVYLFKEKGVKLTKDDVLDYLIYLAVGLLVGGRIGYVISHFNLYVDNLLSIFYIWKGGMAFHGGLIGSVLAGWLFSRKKKIDFYKLADVTMIPLALVLALGRIGNFINGELYGRVTNVWWAVKFNSVEGFRHPSQIYESFKNLLIFFILFFNRKRKHRDGFIFWLFIMLYGLFRFIVEFYREFSYYFFGLSFTQILSMIMFLVGLYFVYKKR